MEISGGKLATYQESQEDWNAWKLSHAALWDKDNRNHENYGIASWPTAYIIGPDGKVFWEGNPAMLLRREKEVAKLKKLIEEKLRSSSVDPVQGGSETQGDCAILGNLR